MSLLGGLEPPAKRVPKCRIIAIHDSLSAADQKVFIGAVENLDDWPTDALARELKKRGIEVGRETIRAHRRGDCICVAQ